MNKKIISAAVLLGLSGAATAVNLNQDGLGQVLLYPYFTTNGGHQTHVMVVNTTNQAKAVKVRFKEGVNSWEVLDFNVYMSPYDVWTGVIFQDENEDTRLGTNDNTCISPRQLPEMIEHADGSITGGQPFNPLNITKWGSQSDEPKEAETGLTAKDRLKEGYLEVIEMGNADVSTPFGAQWAADVTHVQDGTNSPVPKNCQTVVNAWGASGEWRADSRDGMAPVSGGLFGTARIINAAYGIDRAYDATAVDNFWQPDDIEVPGVQGVVAHALPGDSFPDLAGRVRNRDGSAGLVQKGDQVSYVTVSENNATAVKATFFQDSIDAFSSTITVDKIYNQFLIADFAKADTDWVVNFPTKHAYVNPNTSNVTASEGQYGLLSDHVSQGGNCILLRDPVGYCQPFNDGHDVTISPVIFGTEEQEEVPTLNFSPSSRPTNAIPYEVNVLSFDESATIGAEGTNVFNSKLGNRIQTSYPEGWASISFGDGQISGTDIQTQQPRTFYGRPVIGFASIAAKRDAGSMNYAELYNHKYSRNVVNS